MTTEKKDRPRIIAKLIEAGHSPNKALEVALDAERGDIHALAWVRKVTGHSLGKQPE